MRTIYISNPAYLYLENRQMQIKNHDELRGSIPIEDMGVLILDHPQVTITHGLIRYLQLSNVLIVSCDEKHMPYGIMLPLEGHSEQTKHQRYQLQASKPLKSNLWKQIVKQKIENQASVLKKLKFPKHSRHLLKIAERVQTADKADAEGYAASVYWNYYFGGLKRGREEEPPNNYLNYGYAILRSMVARAIVGAGLLPTIGIHHHNKYNPFGLADDLMEPFRPFVDLLVLDLIDGNQNLEQNLQQEERNHLLSIMTVDGVFGNKKRPLMVGVEETAASLRKCFVGDRKKLVLPIIP